jgi:succinate dehydrogenase / fumarate reductase membrane anchor subunit
VVSRWLVQRFTALYLLFFIIFLLLHLLVSGAGSYEAWRAWVLSPVMVVAASVATLALLAHMWVGLRDVLLDYARPVAVRVAALAVLAGALATLGVWILRTLWTGGG